MAARAIWKGTIRAEGLSLGVKLYSAVESSSIGFRLLHEKDKTPVQQRMVNPRTDEVVPYDEVRKGYEVSKGTFVILEPDELEKLEPEPSRDIEILRFVNPSEIDHRWYERPYYLGPDGSTDDYFALTDALQRRNREGVARWTMRKKAYIGALRVVGDYLMLITLRNANEVIAVEDLAPPAGRALDKREKEMAAQLVDALAGEFDPSEFTDSYRERVLELVETKAAGKPVKVKKFRAKKTDEDDLGDALTESLKAMRGRKASGG